DAVPFGGYWFSADDRDDRIGRSSRVGRHKTHFLFTAYPAGRTRGPILGVNESEPVYRWDRRTNSPEWPSEAELQANWSRGD
ncbi:MAG TPA: hypothetical protein VEJ18_18590, partial [Planctomycetota bacterium]|nr:hypothetical protein [Planctomycetota bacterium]